MSLLKNSIIVKIYTIHLKTEGQAMKTLGLFILAALSLSACTTDMSNDAIVNKHVQTHEVVTQYPVEAAILNIYTKARSQALLSVIGGQEMVITNRIIPKGSTVFEGKQVQSAEKNTLIETDHHVVMNLSRNYYFTLTPLVFHGSIDSSDEYSVVTQMIPIPKTAKVGNSSKLTNENVYTDSSRRKKINTYTQTWFLADDSHSTAWLCIENSETLLFSDNPNSSATECYKINAKGDILDSNVTINGDETILFNSM